MIARPAAASVMTWMLFEFHCVDRFFTQKHGNKLFAEYGITGKKLRWNEDPGAFQRWKDGQTGLPLVDANMRELKQTGVPLLVFITKRPTEKKPKTRLVCFFGLYKLFYF